MLELTIRCECKVCRGQIEIRSCSSEFDLCEMEGNVTKDTPFFAYHHKWFGEKGCVASGHCKTCGADYDVFTGVVSVVCNIEYIDEDYNVDLQPEPNYKCSSITFPKWLKLQRHRNDRVGTLARKAFYTEGYSRNYKKYLDVEYPGRPKRAAEYEEWVKYFEKDEDKLFSFYMAWAEYQVLKEHCQWDMSGCDGGVTVENA